MEPQQFAITEEEGSLLSSAGPGDEHSSCRSKANSGAMCLVAISSVSIPALGG